MAAPLENSPYATHILFLLTTAEVDIRADRLADAAATYHFLLSQPGLEDYPEARTEVCANYGALLLHEIRMQATAPDAGQQLERAIALLTEAQRNHADKPGDNSRVTTETNLALAYLQRYQLTGHDGDLMTAHMTLDGAEAGIGPDDWDMKDWIGSVRAMLVEQGRQRPRPR